MALHIFIYIRVPLLARGAPGRVGAAWAAVSRPVGRGGAGGGRGGGGKGREEEVRWH